MVIEDPPSITNNKFSMINYSDRLIVAALRLRDAVAKLRFAPPVAFVYNPLDYAWAAHQAYLQTYGQTRKRILFLGMNPGPFGMVQTGVPFGEIPAVRDWLKLQADIVQPARCHPKRPVQGFACTKSEVSGRRLWGLFAQRYPQAPDFFVDHFVANYCPLAFVEDSGRNRTPDKLPAAESEPLEAACLRHLREVVEILEPDWLIGIGQFAEERATRLGIKELKIGRLPHPSPANPAANRNWAGLAEKQMISLGLWH